MSNRSVRLAESDADIAACFPVMVQLRPHYDPESFAAQVRRQQEKDGYRLAMLVDEDAGVLAVAGYRLGECLAWGRFLYVDDLVTSETARSRGCGGQMMDWLTRQAEREGCAELHLDSGVQRFAAHRFYLRRRMDITSHHFAVRL